MHARAASASTSSLVQVLADVVEQAVKRPPRLHLGQLRKLRLPARAAVIHHQLAGHLARHCLADVVGNQGQGQVDAGEMPAAVHMGPSCT
jgi:hypothetical protein